MSIIKSENFLHSVLSVDAKSSGFDKLSFVPYDLSSDDQQNLTLNGLAETTLGKSDHAAGYLTASNLNSYSPPESPKNWGQVNSNVICQHSDRMVIASSLWLPDITDWWHLQEETYSKYADNSNVTCDIFTNILHGVGVEASFYLWWVIIPRRQSKTTGKTLPEQLVATHCTRSLY